MKNNNMIVVVECKTILADRDEMMYEIMHTPSMKAYAPTCEDPCEHVEITRERIIGKVFNLPNGQRITLGLSDSVSKSLCVPFDVIENQQKEIERLNKMELGLRKRLGELSTSPDGYVYANFWQRIKYVFTKSM